MPLTKREAFKAAFLLRCADDGLTMSETHAKVKEAKARLQDLEKQAANGPWPWLVGNIPGLGALSGATSGIVKDLTGKAVSGGVAAAIGLPLLAGGAAGYGLAQLHGINDKDPEEIKMKEKRDAWRRAALRARMQTASRQRRERTRPSRPLL